MRLLSDSFLIFCRIFKQSGGFFFIGILTLCACSTHKSVAVVDLKANSMPAVDYNVHVVKAGETLYSIALLYDKDYREIAALNGIGENFRIYVGQKLRLNERTRQPAVSKVRANPKVMPPIHASPEVSPVPPVTVESPPDVKNPTPNTLSDKVMWQWPVPGGVIQHFSAQPLGNKGIDISGKRGESVLAAADGIVVFSGTGLVGYGRLIIIKHSDKYLSAYAHNEQLMVTEGEKVKVGQKIAELGSSGTDHEMLHFEIRRAGRPVDPLQYLPHRDE